MTTKVYWIGWLLCFGMLSNLYAQNNLCTYAGNSGNERFNDVLQLSNGDLLIGGSAENLNWLPSNITPTTLATTSIDNDQGSNGYAFFLLLDSTGQQIKGCVTLPQGEAEEIRFIKTTSQPRQTTGDLYVSGTIENNAQGGGYFIGKLNNNFVNGVPTAFAWTYNVKAEDGDYPKEYQPWDVGSDGKVVFGRGDSHTYNWASVNRLNANGMLDVVPQWRAHWLVAGGNYYGDGNQYPGGLSAIRESGIIFKRDQARCGLRSHTQVDYDAWSNDGNGGMKKGKWPLDVLFNSHCEPGAGSSLSGPGYTGYSPASTFTYGVSSITIDRRTNYMYIGFNAKSVLPSGLPDFEPAIMAMDNNGQLLWWSRLYHEVSPTGDTLRSTPDQYIDALAVDYSRPVASGHLVVVARAHGNNVENLWEGNTIAANPTANGYQNRFTGNSGNIHISWIGKLGIVDGTLYNSTYVAELPNTTTGLGSASTDPNLDGWPNPNAGWPTLNTTRSVQNTVKVTADGSVIVLAKARRTMTTANAYQKMPKPNSGGQSTWNYFVRVYQDDLSKPTYSSLLVGTWDTLDANSGNDNVVLRGVYKTNKGLLLAGYHKGTLNDMPTANVPSWGNATHNGESGVFAYFQAPELVNAADGPADVRVVSTTQQVLPEWNIEVFPNPSQTGIFTVSSGVAMDAEVFVTDIAGRVVLQTRLQGNQLDASHLGAGVYAAVFTKGTQRQVKQLVLLR